MKLTSGANDQAGALWWTDVMTFDVFDVKVTFRVKPRSSGDFGDGFAFAWVRDTLIPNTGGAGGGLGVSSLDGFAVIVDLYESTQSIPTPYVAVVDTKKSNDGWILEARAIGVSVGDDAEHLLRVQLDARQVTVHVDGVLLIDRFAVSTYAPFAGHWGVTAANGSRAGTHQITAVAYARPGEKCR